MNKKKQITPEQKKEVDLLLWQNPEMKRRTAKRKILKQTK